MKTEFLQRIRDRLTVIGVVGLGYVGLPLAAAFHAARFKIVGFDVDAAKIRSLAEGRSYHGHLGSGVQEMIESDRFEPTHDMTRLGEADAVFICVPTPLSSHLEPDLSYVEETARGIARTLRRGQLIVLESTTYPGTTREIVLPLLEGAGLEVGEDFFLAFSPEREDPGRRDFSTHTIPKLVGGIDSTSGEVAEALYACAIEKVVLVDKAEIAEAAKLLENIYRAVNIAMVNEMKVVLGKMDINVWDVIEAAATKPFGFQPFYPGPGLGGHCIPIDPFYLTWKAREVGLSTRFIELAGEVNRAMPNYVVEQAILALNDAGKAVSTSRILLLGLAYKPDVDDCRESPSLLIADLLQSLGATVDYNDPHVPEAPVTRHYVYSGNSKALDPDMLASYDVVIVSTHHAAYDWQLIADHATLIIDARNALKNVTGRRDHIRLA